MRRQTQQRSAASPAPRPPFGWQRVAGGDRVADQRADLPGRQSRPRLDLGGLRRQRRTLDRLGEPARVVAQREVMEPCRVVDAVRDLDEERQVADTEVELAVRALEIELLSRRLQ